MFRPDLPTSVVFGHPNHELAVFGVLQQIRPEILFLTDGGSIERVNETKRGLESIGLLEKAFFLNYQEDSFYSALLKQDFSFFDDVSIKIKEFIELSKPKQVLCDAVEYYNPVHDVSVPMVKSVLANLERNSEMPTKLFEIPLIYQVPKDSETYALQSLPSSKKSNGYIFELSDQEIENKKRARDEIYLSLVEQMGSIIATAKIEDFATEIISFLPENVAFSPPDDIVIRYEWRGEKLLKDGEINEVILHDKHFAPFVEHFRAQIT